jgi:hypothetical protein
MLSEQFLDEIRGYINSPQIREERSFLKRRRARQAGRILLEDPDADSRIRNDVSDLLREMEELERSVVAQYRQLLLNQRHRSDLRRALDLFTTYRPENVDHLHLGEEDLDLLLDQVFGLDVDATRVPAPGPGMVHLERTPAGVVLELVDRLQESGPTRSLCDLGSGLGHVLILFALLTDLKLFGIEIEPRYHALAMEACRAQPLSRITFLRQDVLSSDLSQYNLFFMFSPFHGPTLWNVLKRLEESVRRRRATVCSYGNSTLGLAECSWLRVRAETMVHPYRAAVFDSSG